MAEDATEEALARKPRGRHPDKRLTAATAKRAGPGRHADGNGLYLEVDATGSRRWVLRTVVHGRRRDLGLGSASLVPLAEARETAARLRRLARDGGDPAAERDKDKRTSLSFAEAARRVHGEQVLPTARNVKAAAQWLTSLETYAFPVMGSKPVHAVDQADVLKVLAPIWTEKAETARRVRQRLRTVLDWARTAGHREGVNPVEGVERGLARQMDRVEHFEALPWADLPALWPRLEAAAGMGTIALRFAILTAARSGEVRAATWKEIDFDGATWAVPAEKMKMKRPHRVPLSEEALAILRALRPMAARPEALVFPGMRGRPLSDMTLAAVLKRLDVPATVHGFRSSFRDWTEEAGAWPHEVKEAALAHAVRSKTEAAYRRSDLFDKRRDLMAAWAAFVTGPAADPSKSTGTGGTTGTALNAKENCGPGDAGPTGTTGTGTGTAAEAEAGR